MGLFAQAKWKLENVSIHLRRIFKKELFIQSIWLSRVTPNYDFNFQIVKWLPLSTSGLIVDADNCFNKQKWQKVVCAKSAKNTFTEIASVNFSVADHDDQNSFFHFFPPLCRTKDFWSKSLVLVFQTVRRLLQFQAINLAMVHITFSTTFSLSLSLSTTFSWLWRLAPKWKHFLTSQHRKQLFVQNLETLKTIAKTIWKHC